MLWAPVAATSDVQDWRISSVDANFGVADFSVELFAATEYAILGS